jgi:hypothetical protein
VRRGARSIRGSLGAYLTASLLALAALALALWLGWPAWRDGHGGRAGGVELAGDAAWTQAVLDDGHRQFTLGRGERVEVPPGSYRLTLLAPDGRAEQRSLELGELPVVLR